MDSSEKESNAVLLLARKIEEKYILIEFWFLGDFGGMWGTLGFRWWGAVRERLRGNCRICKMKLNGSVVGRKNLRKEKSKFCKILIVEEL